MCIWSLGYQACNVHESHYHLCPTQLYFVFPHYLMNGKIFEKQITEYKMCLFSLQLLSCCSSVVSPKILCYKHWRYPSGRDNSFEGGSCRGIREGVPGMGESVEKMRRCSWRVLRRILTILTGIVNKSFFKKIYFMTFGTHLVCLSIDSNTRSSGRGGLNGIMIFLWYLNYKCQQELILAQ